MSDPTERDLRDAAQLLAECDGLTPQEAQENVARWLASRQTTRQAVTLAPVCYACETVKRIPERVPLTLCLTHEPIRAALMFVLAPLVEP